MCRTVGTLTVVSDAVKNIAFAMVALVMVAAGLTFMSLSNNDVGMIGVSCSQFELKTDLPFDDQHRIDGILAIPVAQRTASDSQYLTLRSRYVYNEVLDRVASGSILMAQGQTLPTGYCGFAKGAEFRIVDASNNIRAVYENTGTTGSAIWQAIGLQTATVTLSSASFATIAASPVELVPDPGNGFVIEPIAITGTRIFSSESWNGVDEGLEVKYDGSSGFAVFPSFSKGFTSHGDASSSVASPSYQILMPIQSIVASPSEALYLTASSSHTIDGDTYFKFDIQYRIVPLP